LTEIDALKGLLPENWTRNGSRDSIGKVQKKGPNREAKAA